MCQLDVELLQAVFVLAVHRFSVLVNSAAATNRRLICLRPLRYGGIAKNMELLYHCSSHFWPALTPRYFRSLKKVRIFGV